MFVLVEVGANNDDYVEVCIRRADRFVAYTLEDAIEKRGSNEDLKIVEVTTRRVIIK